MATCCRARSLAVTYRYVPLRTVHAVTYRCLCQSSAAFYLALASLGGCSALTLHFTFLAVAEGGANTGSGQASLLGAVAGGLYIVCTLFIRWRYFLA